MNKRTFILIFMLVVVRIISFSEVRLQSSADLHEEIQSLKMKKNTIMASSSENSKAIRILSSKVQSTEERLDSLNKNVVALVDSLNYTKANVEAKINKTDEAVLNSEISMLSAIKNRTKAGLIALLLLTALGVLFFYLLLKRMTNNGTAIESIRSAQDELSKAQKRIEEESVNLDNKLIDLLDRQVSVSEINAQATPDHSLALKVADEIVRIELNLSRMDKSIRGYKQLSKAVERIKNNFLANGYEITDMLGKPYNEGMRINADFIIDESLPLGTRTITSITKPQVVFNGEMIQKAIVTISQNI